MLSTLKSTGDVIKLRFSLNNGKLIPRTNQFEKEKTYPIIKLPEIPLVPQNPSFTVNPQLQNMLAGKEVLVDDLAVFK